MRDWILINQVGLKSRCVNAWHEIYVQVEEKWCFQFRNRRRLTIVFSTIFSRIHASVQNESF